MLSACLVLHLLAVSQADSEVQSLLDRHQRYLDAIRTLDVEVRADFSEDGGRTWKSKSVVRWRMDRNRQMERFTSVLHGEASPIKGQSTFWDYSFSPDGSRFLEYPDGDLPASLGPANQYGRVRAYVNSRQGFGPIVACYWLFLWGAGPHSTLAESFRAASTRKFLGKVIIDGHELLGLELEEPQHKANYAFYLDPARNYAIVRREVRTSNGEGVHCVLESKEVTPGVFFPMHVQNRVGGAVLDVRVLSVKVNEPLPEDAFVVSFPAGAKVRNGKTGDIYIWGDGAPARVFADNSDVRKWELEQMGYGWKQSVTTFVLTNAALLAVIAGAYLVRTRYLRKALASDRRA